MASPEELLMAAGVQSKQFKPEGAPVFPFNRNEPSQTPKVITPEEIFASIVFDGDEEVRAPKWLVHNLLPPSGVAFIGGQSGAGKTFIVIEMARCLATGEAFFDMPIRERVGVVILAGEGESTITNRIAATKRHHNMQGLWPVSYLGKIPNLQKEEEVSALIASLKLVDQAYRTKFGVRLGVVIFDTLAATFDLDDENDNSEAAKVIAKMKRISDALNGLVIPVHHYGKSAQSGLRGGSGWRAGCDQVISVLADRVEISGEVSTREIAIAKNRDGPERPIGAFELPYVQLGTDEYGEPFGTLAVTPRLDQPLTLTGSATPKPKSVPRTQTVFHEAFLEVLINRGAPFRVGGNGPNVRAVRVQELREEYAKRYATGEGDKQKAAEAARKAFKRALEALSRTYSTESRDGEEWVWNTSSDNPDRADKK